MGAENPSFRFEEPPKKPQMGEIFGGTAEIAGELPDIKSGFQISPAEEAIFFGQRPLGEMRFQASEGEKESREQGMIEGLGYGVQGRLNSRLGLRGLMDLEGEFDADAFFARIKGTRSPEVLPNAAEEVPQDNTPSYDSPNSLERKAARRRRDKFKTPAFETFFQQFQADPNLRKRMHSVSSQNSRFQEDTAVGSELQRVYAGLIAGIMQDREMRGEFMRAIDRSAEMQSDEWKSRLKREKDLVLDRVVVGAGEHGAIFNQAYLAENPDGFVVTFDAKDRLGGQFRADRALYRLNSRGHRKERRSKKPVAGGDGNINTIGQFAPSQMTDWTHQVYATNKDAGDLAAITQYICGQTVLGWSYVDGSEVKLGKNKYQVYFRDKKTGKFHAVTTRSIVDLRGKNGTDDSLVPAEDKRTYAEKGFSQVMTAEQFMAHFGNTDNTFPMDPFIGKKVAVIGDGDYAGIAVETLTWNAPDEAYGASTPQLGMAKRIRWHGPRERVCDDVKNDKRARYFDIVDFFPETQDEWTTDAALIQTREGKVASITQRGGERVIDYNITDPSDIVILAVGPEKRQRDMRFRKLASQPSISVISNTRISRKAIVANKIPREEIYISGPGANLPIPSDVQVPLDQSRVGANSVSIWVTGASTEALALLLAQKDIK